MPCLKLYIYTLDSYNVIDDLVVNNNNFFLIVADKYSDIFTDICKNNIIKPFVLKSNKIIFYRFMEIKYWIGY